MQTLLAPEIQLKEFHPVVVDLHDAHPDMLSIVGGKALNLGEMLRAGFPVPPGVCVTTEAYKQVAASSALDFEALESQRPDAPAAAREALLGAVIPDSIASAIVEGYRSLGDNVPVAVRSSATAEDLPGASFAGQQDTYLNIIGSQAVLAAVRRCWASLWTDRAVVYRATNRIDHRTVRLAVVIQRMVQSEIAGVMFTANPVTGARDHTVIDASPGLGEAVVSGSVNPDHFVVETESGRILETRLGDKRVEVRASAGGGVTHVEREASDATTACIDTGTVQSLATLGRQVQDHYGAPQDTEWAIDVSGQLWLTQARPITTLFPLPEETRADGLRVHFSFSVAQGLYRPITPMGLAAFRLMATAGARLLGIPVSDALEGPYTYVEAGQRVFVDLTGIMRGRIGRMLMPRVLDVMESRSAEILRSLFSDRRLSVTRKSPVLFLKRILRLAWKYAVPVQVLRAITDPEGACKQAESVGNALAERLKICPYSKALERLDFCESILLNEPVQNMPKVMPAAAVGLGLLGAAGKLLGKDVTEAELQTVLRGLPNNVTTEMDLALWNLAESIRVFPDARNTLLSLSASELARQYHQGGLPEPAQKGLARFLAQYGQRAVAEIDLGMPRWSDDPAHILGVLANYLRHNDPNAAPDVQFQRGAMAAEAMIETLVERARRRSFVRAALVRFALKRSRQLSGLRELPKYNAILVLAAARRELSIIGAELADRGLLRSAEDIFFLDLKEVRSAINGASYHETVVERRTNYEFELRRRHVPRVLLSNGTEPEAQLTPNTSANGLTGTPASSGSVTGIARVILDPVGAHLEPGEILVSPSTDPGWTPLFLTAGGLVMEMGGANSHGAVVAREYGIPAVVGVAGATTRIMTGQRITVDGAAGVISLGDEQ